MKNKNPQVKEGTLKFLGRCLSTSTTPVPPPQIKPLAENLATLLEDSFEGARNEAATCFGTLMKMVGERPLNAVMENIADVRKAKVKEAFEKATVKCKAGPAPRAPAPAAKKSAPTRAAASKSSEPTLADDTPPPPSKKQPEPEKPDTLLLDGEPPKKPLGKPPARLLVRDPSRSEYPSTLLTNSSGQKRSCSRGRKSSSECTRWCNSSTFSARRQETSPSGRWWQVQAASTPTCERP